MPNTQQPSNLFADLFAANGNITVIPNTNDPSTGRASLQAGFPPITQQPPALGGIAPTRTDFNGILYMLSAFAFFAQSGGVFEYNQTLDYGTPAIVFYDNDLWFCIAENGVNKPSGVQIPADGSIYWQTLKSFLGSGGGGGNPVGTIIMFYGTTPPEGYLACNGSSFNSANYPELAALLGSSITPDFRGLAPRGYDSNSTRDPEGSTRTIGSYQGDAAINLTGSVSGIGGTSFDYAFGVFELYSESVSRSGTIVQNHPDNFNFDASRVWGEDKISTEFRMKNFSILYCIKHD